MDPIGVAGGINIYNSVSNNLVNGFSSMLGHSSGGGAIIGTLGSSYYVDAYGRFWSWEEASAFGSGFVEGFAAGGEIVANTLSFGATDALGLTDSSRHQGGVYDASRALATIGREAALAAATLGTAQAVTAARNAGTLTNGLLYTARGLAGLELGRGVYGLGHGLSRVYVGDYFWGSLEAALSALGIGAGAKSYLECIKKVKVDLFGGKSSKLDDHINFDKQAVNGIADDIENFPKYFSPNSISHMNIDNPMASFLDIVEPSLAKGAEVVIRGQFKNRNFADIFDMTSYPGFKIIKKTKNAKPATGHVRNDGSELSGNLHEIILEKL